MARRIHVLHFVSRRRDKKKTTAQPSHSLGLGATVAVVLVFVVALVAILFKFPYGNPKLNSPSSSASDSLALATQDSTRLSREVSLPGSDEVTPVALPSQDRRFNRLFDSQVSGLSDAENWTSESFSQSAAQQLQRFSDLVITGKYLQAGAVSEFIDPGFSCGPLGGYALETVFSYRDLTIIAGRNSLASLASADRRRRAESGLTDSLTEMFSGFRNARPNQLRFKVLSVDLRR